MKQHGKINFIIGYRYKQDLSLGGLFLVTETSPNFSVKTQNTSNIKHWSQCQLYIYFRKVNKNKSDNYFPTHSFLSGWQMARFSPSSSGHKVGLHPGQDTIHCHSHSHPHSHWSSGDTLVNLVRTAVGCGKKPENLEENHAATGQNVQTPHR